MTPYKEKGEPPVPHLPWIGDETQPDQVLEDECEFIKPTCSCTEKLVEKDGDGKKFGYSCEPCAEGEIHDEADPGTCVK